MDLFAGSGTCATACLMTGRDCFVSDLDPRMRPIILNRAEETYRRIQEGTIKVEFYFSKHNQATPSVSQIIQDDSDDDVPQSPQRLASKQRATPVKSPRVLSRSAFIDDEAEEEGSGGEADDDNDDNNNDDDDDDIIDDSTADQDVAALRAASVIHDAAEEEELDPEPVKTRKSKSSAVGKRKRAAAVAPKANKRGGKGRK